MMRENPRIDPCVDNCGVLDETRTPTRRSTASITPRGLQLGADLLLHKL